VPQAPRSDLRWTCEPSGAPLAQMGARSSRSTGGRAMARRVRHRPASPLPAYSPGLPAVRRRPVRSRPEVRLNRLFGCRIFSDTGCEPAPCWILSIPSALSRERAPDPGGANLFTHQEVGMAPVELHPSLEPARWARIDLDPTRWRVAEGCRSRSSQDRERSAAGRSPQTGTGQTWQCPDEVMI
jgi:hypothetical protein